MLPRRQPPPDSKRLRSPHTAAPRLSVRQLILGALALVFVVGVFLNFQLLSQTGDSANNANVGHASSNANNANNANNKANANSKKLAQQLAFETREVKHIAFTSGCSELDLVHAEVLAHSLRATGYAHNISHLVYGCSHPEFEELQRKKNPKNGVEHVGFPVIKSPVSGVTLFGEELLTTTIHAQVLQQWFTQELNRNRLKDDDFVMLVESDAIFHKKPDIWNLFREVEDIADPKWFGQDASWYWPKRSPLPLEELSKVMPAKSPALKIRDWRDYAATGPYVVEVALLRKVLPTVVSVWEKLDVSKKYLAFPLAAAHISVAFGISGALSIHNYPSRYENWDFVDDITYNPCNQTASAKDVAMLSWPITMRAQNFTLQQWIDGRDWSFFDWKIPRDFFHCDAWLLREPSPEIWDLASFTKGYERVPIILRRRHTMSVCMALQAYNAAATSYKQTYCPRGFNSNKHIPMEHDGKTWASAVAYGDREAKTTTAAYYGDVKKPETTKTPLLPGQAKSDDVHFVFATGCSPDEHWQSDLLSQSFVDVKQRGRLTRVVAGCSDAEVKQLMERTKAAYPHVELFMTKSYATKPSAEAPAGDVYAGYNTPFGLRDWIRGANPPVQASTVVLVNGDFVFTRPLTFNSGHRVTSAKNAHSENYKQHSEVIEGLRVYKPFFVYEGQRSVDQVSDAVSTGVALAQRTKILSTGLEATLAKVCPQCSSLSADDVREYYSVGPPVVLTRMDLLEMVDDFCAMTVMARQLDKTSSTAELVGLMAASAKHKVKYTTFNNLAVRGSGGFAGDGTEGEFWGFLEFVTKNPCDDKISEPGIVAESPRVFGGATAFKFTDPDSGKTWVYDKNLVPANVFACDSWLLALPPASIWEGAKQSRDKLQMRDAYGVCTSIKLLNAAVVKQRERVCVGGYNQNKKLKLVYPRPSDALRVGDVAAKWEAAANAMRR